MSKAWPFEEDSDVGRYDEPEEFAEARDGTEAVVIRIGLHDAQLVLVDGQGAWQRWVYPSMEEAVARAESLGVEVHEGDYPEEARVRMNAFQRPQRDFDRGAYPEQGAVGPVIPYPENRPRRDDVLRPPAPQAKEEDESS